MQSSQKYTNNYDNDTNIINELNQNAFKHLDKIKNTLKFSPLEITKVVNT